MPLGSPWASRNAKGSQEDEFVTTSRSGNSLARAELVQQPDMSTNERESASGKRCNILAFLIFLFMPPWRPLRIAAETARPTIPPTERFPQGEYEFVG